MEINIIAHRGFWETDEQKNSIVAFKHALNCGFGIETDLRDYAGDLVISHDIASEEAISFSDFMALVNAYLPQTIALNIKSDGLHHLVKEGLSGYNDYFCFDMSVPDTLGYDRQELTFYTRFSDIEKTPSLLEEAAGVWVDNFSSNTLNLDLIDDFLLKNKDVVLVSPELHGFEYKNYWRQLLDYLRINPSMVSKVGLCTDFPLDAQEFFNNA